ncbi:MAG: histidine phosphatase family protein [Methyloligellaceae bacterium]
MRRLPFRHRRPVLAICFLLLVSVAGEAAAQTAQPAPDPLLIEKLKRGGYNLYVRHAATDWSQSDKISAYGDWVSCDPGKIRQLSEEGRRVARTMGAAFRALGIRLGQVFASPYCRTMETAQLMSGQDVEPTIDLMNLRSEAYVGGRDAVVARARRRLSRRPADGVNDLFAAHGNLGRAATGQSLSEGEILVVKPMGNGRFDIVGTLTPMRLKTLTGP